MLFDRLSEIAGRAPSSGLQQGDTFECYADLATRIERLAAGLVERGMGRGDVVALLMPNSPDIFAISHALFAIGAIAMPLGLAATRAELATLATKTGLSAVVATPSHRAMAETLIADVAPDAPLFSTDRLVELERGPVRLPQIAGTTPALYLFSSGSTGQPKVVPHTHSELLADGDRTSGVWDLQPDDVVLNILPPNFAMGFLLGVTNAMSGGATTFYWSDPLPLALSRKRLVDAMLHRRVTLMGAVPAMYEIIAQAGEHDLKLRVAFSGGAALKRSTFEAVQARLGTTLRQAYGSTEAIMVAHNKSDNPDRDWASVGPPAGDASVCIAPMDSPLGPGVGELLVRSSSLTQGYLGESVANAQSFEDGWFRTGDLATVDEEGRIFIRGRSKLLIEISGYKIDPIEVEDVLASHADIAEAAVIGIPDQRSGHRLRAFVVKRADISADDVIRHARARLSVQKVPAEIAFIDALPRSSTGKLLRARLSDL